MLMPEISMCIKTKRGKWKIRIYKWFEYTFLHYYYYRNGSYCGGRVEDKDVPIKFKRMGNALWNNNKHLFDQLRNTCY